MVAGLLPLCCTEESLEAEGSGDDKEMSVSGFGSSMTVLLESGVGLLQIQSGDNKR